MHSQFRGITSDSVRAAGSALPSRPLPIPPDPSSATPWRDAAVIRVSGACARIIRIVERRHDGQWHYRAIRGSTGRRAERIITPDTDDGAYFLTPDTSRVRLDTDRLLDAMHRSLIRDGGAAGPGRDLLLHWLAHEIAREPTRRGTRAGEIALLQVVRVSSTRHPELGALALRHMEQFLYEWTPGTPVCAE
jgi:hypothetical protein